MTCTFVHKHRRCGEVAIAVFSARHFTLFRSEDMFNILLRSAVAYIPNTATLSPYCFTLHIPLCNNFKFQSKQFIYVRMTVHL